MEELIGQPSDYLICFYLRVVYQDAPGNIAEAIQRTRDHVGKRLKVLEVAGYVEDRGNNVWRITRRGQEFANPDVMQDQLMVTPLKCDWPEDRPVE